MITELHIEVAEHKAAAKEILANAVGRELNATERSNFDEHISAGEKACRWRAGGAWISLC